MNVIHADLRELASISALPDFRRLMQAACLRLPAYAVNRSKQLVKLPRIFWGDTSVTLHLGATAPAGAHLEKLVLHTTCSPGATRGWTAWNSHTGPPRSARKWTS